MIGHIIIREAENELRDATRFYKSRATGLGLDFLSEIEKSIQSMVSLKGVSRTRF